MFFKSSTNLAAAYGIAVTGTMLVTTILVFALAVRGWKWPWSLAIPVFAVFLVVDATLLSANMLKFHEGGWVPIVIAVAIFSTMWTWMKGRAAVVASEKEGALPMEELIGSISPGRVHRPQGTAVYLTAFSDSAPGCLLHNLKHNEVLHEHVVLLTIEVADEPYVAADQRAEVGHLGKGVHRVVLRYGFMEQPDVPRDLAPLTDRASPSIRCAPPTSSAATAMSAPPGRCCRAGSRSCSWCWPASPSAPPTSSACRPTARSSWAAGSRSNVLQTSQP